MELMTTPTPDKRTLWELRRQVKYSTTMLAKLKEKNRKTELLAEAKLHSLRAQLAQLESESGPDE
jgi:hypothetical protein